MKNTALYNKVLEAMDKGQIVVFKYVYGYSIPTNTVWYATGYISAQMSNSATMNIYYENGATNLYVPTTLTAVEPVTESA